MRALAVYYSVLSSWMASPSMRAAAALEFVSRVCRLLFAAPCSSYNRVVEQAFRTCVHGFRSNTLTEKEKKCVMLNTGKLLRFSDRLGHRWSEAQVKLAQAGAAGSDTK